MKVEYVKPPHRVLMKRGSRESSHKRGYDRKWARYRKAYLIRNPWCIAPDCIAPANEVDHITPLAQAPELKYVDTNLQALCKSCHSKKTKRDNKKG